MITETSIIKKLTGGRRQDITISRKENMHTRMYYGPNFSLMLTKCQIIQIHPQPITEELFLLLSPHQFEGKGEDRQLLSKLTTRRIVRHLQYSDFTPTRSNTSRTTKYT